MEEGLTFRSGHLELLLIIIDRRSLNINKKKNHQFPLKHLTIKSSRKETINLLDRNDNHSKEAPLKRLLLMMTIGQLTLKITTLMKM